MHDPQRERLGLLLERAIALPRGDRARFIEESSGDDFALRDELISLVEASDPSAHFFDDLARHVGPALASTLPSEAHVPERDVVAIGDVVGHYQIRERIGGGMGVVYRADDLRLDRPVALKFLPASLAADERARARLYAEARAASALYHPHIGTVYDVAESEPGGLFIVLAWCEGETVKEALARGPLPVPEAVTLAREVASALAAAHAGGVIHRDVKPSNIVRSPKRGAKLVDFGIAKAADAEPTREGWTPGTVAYMSPEQTRGERVDARTDIWSLGVVLYEMLAGRRPFRGEHDATLVHAIREDAPEPLAKLREEVPAALVRIVERCLAKDAADRYATADELQAALAAVEVETAEGAALVSAEGRVHPDDGQVSGRSRSRGAIRGIAAALPRMRHSPRRRNVAVAAAVLSLVILAASGWYALGNQAAAAFRDAPLGADEPAMLAVLPFRVSGPELDGWGEAMVDLLSSGLDGAGGIRAVDSRTLLARWSHDLENAEAVDLSSALQVARGTGARFAVEGSAVSIGRQVRLVARLHDLENSRRVGFAQVEGSLDSPHALVDDLGVELLRILLGGEVDDLPEVDLAAVTTSSVEALRAYLAGERHYRAGRWEDAATAYLRAVEIDSTFALAHHRADLALGWGPPTPGNLQRQHREAARRLSDRLPERERLLVNGTYRLVRNTSDSTVLENSIEEAVRSYPTDAEAWYLLAEAYYHRSFIKRPAEVEALFATAIALDSSFAGYRIHHIDYALHQGDSALAARRTAGYRAVVDPEDPRLPGYETSLRLWFADRLTQYAALDSIRDAALRDPFFLTPPPSAAHMLRVQQTGLEFLLELLHGPEAPFIPVEPAAVMRDLARNLANQGRFAEALELLDHRALVGTDQRRCILAEFAHIGVPVTRAALRAGMGDPGLPAGSGRGAFCGAQLAVILGDRPAFERGIARLRALEEESFARTAEAYWQWKREGQPDRAARRLLATDGTFEEHYWTFWMGDIYRELGRLEAAEEAYLTSMHPMAPFIQYSLAWYHLANIYEELGDTPKAREAWERVVVAWERGDPELQPRVEEARARLRALQ